MFNTTHVFSLVRETSAVVEFFVCFETKGQSIIRSVYCDLDFIVDFVSKLLRLKTPTIVFSAEKC